MNQNKKNTQQTQKTALLSEGAAGYLVILGGGESGVGTALSAQG